MVFLALKKIGEHYFDVAHICIYTMYTVFPDRNERLNFLVSLILKMLC